MPSRARTAPPIDVTPAPRWYVVKDAAVYLGLTISQVYRRVHLKQISCVNDGRVRFTQDDLDEYLARHRTRAHVPPAPPTPRLNGDDAIADLLPSTLRLS
jgi:excisionase family DNA binding protein